MYLIDTKKDKPDLGYSQYYIEKLMARGIKLGDCEKLRQHYTDLKDVLSREITYKYGIQNPNSSKQITDYLEYLSQRVELESRNDIINNCYDERAMKWTSKAEALEKLADLGYEFAQDLLDYRHAKKYAESIQSIMDAADSNGYVHPSISFGKTNRINYSRPGLMTIPKKLLWNIIAPTSDDYVLYSVDIKNQEPNILINMVNAEELKPALLSDEGLYETMFKQCFKPFALANVVIDTLPEDRVYTSTELANSIVSPAKYRSMKPMTRGLYYNDEKITGIETVCIGSSKGKKPELPSKVTVATDKGNMYSIDVEWEDYGDKYKKAADYEIKGYLIGCDIRIEKIERKEFKQSWLAITYGASSFGIKSICKNIDSSQVYNFITNINGIKEYRKNIDKLARNGINSIGTIFGTRLVADCDTDDYKRLKRVLLDLPIQGSGADILSLLIKHFVDETNNRGLSDSLELYYTRHDELILQVNKKWLYKVGDAVVEDTIRDIMEHQIINNGEKWVPFKVEVVRVEPSDTITDLSDDN